MKDYILSGAVIGDTIGSTFEWDNYKPGDDLIRSDTHPTDDSVMTLAIAKALIDSYPIEFSDSGMEVVKKNAIKEMVAYYNTHSHGYGYGGHFKQWCKGYNNYEPYNSYGNGSAMRISSVAYACNSIEEVKMLSKAVTEVTHNHPEGIKGAESIAVATFMARMGYKKEEIKDYIVNNYYPEILDFDLDDLIENYEFDVSCQGSCNVALYCFFISDNFFDAIKKGLLVGGDTDTICAMIGSIAEAYYKELPVGLSSIIFNYLDEMMISTIEEFNRLYIK